MLVRYQSRLLSMSSSALDVRQASSGLGQTGPKSPALREARRAARRRAVARRNSTSRCPPLCYLVLPSLTASVTNPTKKESEP